MKKSEEQQFKKMFIKGCELIVISKTLNVSKTTVHKWRKKHFPNIQPINRKAELFNKLYLTGIFTIDEMTLLLNMHKNSVQRLRRSRPITTQTII